MQHSRAATLIAGVGLVFVPTAWAVFPGWGKWYGPWRALVIAGWVAVAVFIVSSTNRQARQVDDLMGEAEKLRRDQREALGENVLVMLLRNRAAGMQPYKMIVYLHDHGVLTAVACSDPDDDLSALTWRVGHGATGYAFATGSRVVARQPKASDETYTLTPEQQRMYADLAIVVAMPIENSAGRSIGVLTASGAPDDGYFASDRSRFEPPWV